MVVGHGVSRSSLPWIVASSAEVLRFFFSSRRRHTRSLCDWSSDVCSSDLHLGNLVVLHLFLVRVEHPQRLPGHRIGEYRPRSEERRVGKECRSRGGGDHHRGNERYLEGVRVEGKWTSVNKRCESPVRRRRQ